MRIAVQVLSAVCGVLFLVSACAGAASTSPTASASGAGSVSPAAASVSSSVTPTSPSAVPSPSAGWQCPAPPAGKHALCPTKGSAQAKVSGKVTASFAGAVDPTLSVVFLPDGSLTLAYKNQASEEVLVQADAAKPGTYRTGAGSYVKLNVGGNVLGSSAGECTLLLSKVSATTIAGSFSCKGIPAAYGVGPDDATGSFDAAP